MRKSRHDGARCAHYWVLYSCCCLWFGNCQEYAIAALSYGRCYCIVLSCILYMYSLTYLHTSFWIVSLTTVGFHRETWMLFIVLIDVDLTRWNSARAFVNALCFSLLVILVRSIEYCICMSWGSIQKWRPFPQEYKVVGLRKIEGSSQIIALSFFQCFVTVSLRHKDIWGPIYKIFYDLAYDYRKFSVRSTYDSDIKRAEISFRNIVS